MLIPFFFEVDGGFLESYAAPFGADNILTTPQNGHVSVRSYTRIDWVKWSTDIKIPSLTFILILVFVLVLILVLILVVSLGLVFAAELIMFMILTYSISKLLLILTLRNNPDFYRDLGFDLLNINLDLDLHIVIDFDGEIFRKEYTVEIASRIRSANPRNMCHIFSCLTTLSTLLKHWWLSLGLCFLVIFNIVLFFLCMYFQRSCAVAYGTNWACVGTMMWIRLGKHSAKTFGNWTLS